ncbi:MAG: hypothetical protein EAX96_18405 [Candidatus Lokiarchaeota archaeon]|nr:hypothetical protein [Candidatus Lokiarchaeota archaeon]
MNASDEANNILTKLHEIGLGLEVISGDRVYEGLPIDYRTAITEMKESNYRYWKEMEWPAYYISFLLESSLSDSMNVVDEDKRVCFEAASIWDVRVKSMGSNTPWVILTDVQNMNRTINNHNGFGLIIIRALMNYELKSEVKDYHDELKGGPSEYSKKILLEGRKPRRRKKVMFLIDAFAYHFQNLEEFREGIINGWLKDNVATNWRNSDESPRNPKYKINISRIPEKFKVIRHNFNYDIDEFEDEEQEEIIES